MSEESAQGIMTNREFVALVRAKLDAAGHTDVAIDRQWIDQDTPGHVFLLNVPVGTEFSVPLKPMSGFFDEPTSKADWFVGHFADALVNLRAAERMLVKYANDVRRAANREIATARAAGLDILLDRVGFKPTYAYHLTGSSWKEAAYHILAEVSVRVTSFHLRPETRNVWVEEPADLARELKDILGEQRERQDLLAKLEARGFDLEVDAITLDLLTAHGLDAEAVLRDVWKRQCVNLKVQHLGAEHDLSIISFDGRTSASLLLDDVCWNGEYLWFRDPGRLSEDEARVGRSLGGLVNHPVLSRRPVVRVEDARGPGRELFYFDLSDKLLFDADTGRLWREERLAA